MDSPPRLRIGVVGAGRVGAVLGAALRAAGHNCIGVSAVSDLSCLRAAALLPGVPIKPADQVVAESELLILAVPDQVLPELIRGFSSSEVFVPGQFVAHTSGSYGISVCDTAPQISPMAIHPAMMKTGLGATWVILESFLIGLFGGMAYGCKFFLLFFRPWT